MRLSLAVLLDIAVGIELKGIEVYEQLKQRTGSTLLDHLITQERNHIRVFQKLFSNERAVGPEETLETPHLDEDYLADAYASTEVFGAVKPANAPVNSLFALAVAMEKESIRFYLELLDELPEPFERPRALLRQIVDEERHHLRDLLAKKESLMGPRERGEASG